MVRPPISRLNIKKKKFFSFNSIHGNWYVHKNLIQKTLRCAMLLKSDSEILLAVQQNGLALRYVPKNSRNYREVVLAAVQQNDRALRFASNKLRGDKKVVLTASKKDYGNSLKFASKDCILYFFTK